MWTAIIVITLVFLFIIGGMMLLLKNKDFKLPKDYDPSKSGYQDDHPDGKGNGSINDDNDQSSSV